LNQANWGATPATEACNVTVHRTFSLSEAADRGLFYLHFTYFFNFSSWVVWWTKLA